MGCILVTHFKRHWDQKREANFPIRLIKNFPANRILAEKEIKAIFIKTNNEDKTIENIWSGSVFNFKIEKEHLFFELKILRKENDLKEKYKEYTESGWYPDSMEIWLQTVAQKKLLRPPLFDLLNETKHPSDFETYVFLLLRALGITEIIKFDPDNSGGKPDGLFTIRDLAVIYDCTLNPNYLKKGKRSKETQINNYTLTLRDGKFVDSEEIKFIPQKQKQVWIITKGKYEVISQDDVVSVKEIPIDMLIEIFFKRLYSCLDEAELSHLLVNI